MRSLLSRCLLLTCLLLGLACCPCAGAGTITHAVCRDPFCTQCVPRGGACPACQPHFRAARGTCKPCTDPACASCNAGPGRCSECVTGYIKVNGVCKPNPCGDGCLSCAIPISGSAPKCRLCSRGLRLVNGRCQRVSPYNILCKYDTAGRCTSCLQDYGCAVQKNGTCVPCSDRNCSYPLEIGSEPRCQLCQLGYGPRLGTDDNFAVLGGCVRCAVPLCASCRDIYTKCNVCTSGYTLVKGKCVACPRHCLSCNSKGPSACDPAGVYPVCTPGYGPNGKGACIPCTDSNCRTCSDNARVCEACNDGFVSVNGTCGACKPKNCLRCFAELRTCTGCSPGWGKDAAGGCGVNCARSTGDPLCRACSTSPTVCDACPDGHSLRLNARGQLRCQPCQVKNCKYCFVSSTICYECAEGYTLRLNGSCS